MQPSTIPLLGLFSYYQFILQKVIPLYFPFYLSIIQKNILCLLCAGHYSRVTINVTDTVLALEELTI